ncbi:MAG: response regulator [Pseudomonadota bacterium]|nr:response regulator [Pseudomonadota bacterium]
MAPTTADGLHQALVQCREDNELLRAELEEARETLAAIQSGAVDALVVDTPDGQRVYTLEGAEYVYRTLIERMQEGAVILTCEGTIHYCNRRFADLIKMPLEKVVGRPFADWVDAADHPALNALLTNGVDRLELLLHAHDGATTPTMVSIAAVPESSLSGRCLVVTDLTERLRDQARLAEAERLLWQSQKLDAIGQLTGGIAHDFNNLLMVIAGGVSLLERPGDAGRRLRVLAQMRHATERGASLSRKLLAFSRRQPLNPEPVDLRRQIDGMRELLDRTLRGDVEVKTELADDLWPIKVDAAEWELVVLNLCVNARDAMPDGGVITIGGRNASQVRHGELAGDFVVVSVRDTGTGMSADVLTHIFEPFFTTKEIGKGSGLGLAQVYGFTQQSGGTITVASVVGGGTTVTMLLPRTTDSPAEPVPRRPDSTARPNGRLGSILLVEDNDEVAMLVSEMLRELGYQVTRAASAQGALGALADEREIDLVFSDIMMPGTMNGMELAREVRRRRPGAPILLTTGFAGAAVQDGEVGDIEILSKPYAIEALAAALRVALGEHASL